MREAPSTLDAMYQRHAPSVFRRARALLGTDADAHEVVQDVFMTLLENPDQYERRSAMTTFLYSVTTHACLNRIRNQKARVRLLNEHALAGTSTPSTPSPEQISVLHDVLKRMPDELARAAIYYWVDELTQDDIARILGCSRRHVGHLLERVTGWARAQEATPC